MSDEERRFDNDWGTIDRLLAEFGPMVPVLTQGENSPQSLRAFTRWLFSVFDTLTHALKKIAVRQAERRQIELTRREQEVLQIIQEPAFPGLPPPRRVEAPLREGLTTALRVFARARGVEPPLVDGMLPRDFIDASVVSDRFSRPGTGEELDPTRGDYVAVGKAVLWFRELQQWLHRERMADLEETKQAMHESFEAMRQKVSKPPQE
jgi:hypothetical protein